MEENKNETPYTLILRTFGRDLDKTVAELERRTPIRFVSQGHFNNDGHLAVGDQIKKSLEDIRSVIKPFEHSAWQDNYARWKAHKFIKAGKIFPIDSQNENLISIFWGDNIGANHKKIVSLQLSFGEEIADYHKFEDALIQLKHLVAVQTKQAIKDDDCFIKLKNFAYYGKSVKKLKVLQDLIYIPHTNNIEYNQTALIHASNSPFIMLKIFD